MVFKVQDGIEFATRAEWRNYMMYDESICQLYFILDLVTYHFYTLFLV